MTADRAAGTCRCPSRQFHLVSGGINWIIWPCLAFLTLICMMAGAGSYPFFSPDEARHAGIVYDMWEARQYLIPRVDGFPVLDGAPLYYWLSLAFVSVFGVQEWVLRLPSAIAASLLLVFFARFIMPAAARRQPAALLLPAAFLMQPALQLAGRFASPDMLNLLLLTLALGGFLRACERVEQGRWAVGWALGAWVCTALLGLGAGALAILPPLLTVALWLGARRRLGMIASLWWKPGLAIVALMLLPWLLLANARYPGIVAIMLREQFLAVAGGGGSDWALPEYKQGWLLLLAGALPLAAFLCCRALRRPRLRFNTAAAGLMAAWLVVLVPLHPLMVSAVAGHALVLVVPLLYFGVLALAPERASRGWREVLPPCALFCAVAAAVSVAGAHVLSQRISGIVRVTEAISPLYNANTDKAIMLDRFDYAFNFYLRSSKLVYVATDWTVEPGSPAPRWKRDLSLAARFVPETASRMLLTAHPGSGSGPLAGNPASRRDAAAIAYDDLMDRLCERRVVNLWVLGSDESARRYPILEDLRPVVSEGKVRAWYLAARRDPGHCLPWLLQ